MKALAELSKLASKANKGQAKQAKIDSIVIGGQKHTVVKATNGDIIVNHPGSKKTTFKKIDLTKNEKLESLFFTYWNQIDYNNKLTTYKGNDAKEEDKYFFKDFVKEYFIKKIIEYPSVSELYKFRKDISQDELKIALKNIFNNTKFFKMNNQRKEDYWENHIKGNEPNKLLDLIEISGLEKDDLIKWNKIGFLNDIRQLRFDKLLNQNKIDLIKSILVYKK